MRFWLFVTVCVFLSACAPRLTSAPSPVSGTTGPGAASAATRSAGCDRAPLATPPARLTVGGRTRDLITVVPANYDPRRPYSLVLAFHGRTNSSAQARAYFGLEGALPDTIFVYPSGLRQGRGYSWADPGDPPDALRDYAFFDTTVQTMAAAYCLDENRVFVVGHSLGAYFANSLACARPGMIRAVASLAGGLAGTHCRGPVAALIMHNPKDGLVAVAQGAAARDAFRAVDGATGAAVPLGDPLMQAFRCVQYGAGRAPVVWCPHPFDTRYDGSYYPHTWPELTAAAVADFFATLQ